MSTSSISAEISNKLLSLLRKQVIILLIGHFDVDDQTSTSQIKIGDIENAVQNNVNNLKDVNRVKANYSSAEMNETVEGYLNNQQSVLIVDRQHENVRYHWEGIGEAKNIPVVAVVLPNYTTNNVATEPVQDWHAICARERLELIIVCK